MIFPFAFNAQLGTQFDAANNPGAPNAFGLTGGEANAPAAGKRPLSSMSPTIVLKNGKPFLVTGSPGGSRIITTVLQVISDVIDRRTTITEAVAEFEQNSREMYDQMARIAITPHWVRYYDFGAGRLPRFLQELAERNRS